MIPTSQAWKDYSRDIGAFHIKATIRNGSSVLNLTDKDFMQRGISFTDSMSGMSEIALGAVVTNTFSATLNNFDGKFDNYNFSGATISVQFGIVFGNGTEEWINRGVYTIDKPNNIGNTIKIECYDQMDKLNRNFNGFVTTTYPVTYKALIQAICTACGVTFGTWDSAMANSNVTAVIASAFNESTTCRQVVSWILESVGGYARINPVTNRLDCLVWNRAQWSTSDVINGGIFNVWNSVSTYSGGTISPWSVVTDRNGGTFFDGDGAYALEKVKNQTIYVDDIEVTGIRAYVYDTADEASYGSAGSAGYVLSIHENPFVGEGNKTTVANEVWSNVQGLKVRPFQASLFGDPSIEAGDTIILRDIRTDSYYISIITNLTFNLGGDMRVSCDAKTPEENALEYANPQDSAVWVSVKYTDQVVDEAMEEVDGQIDSKITTYDTSLNQTKVFNKLTNNGAMQGLYMDNGNMYVNASYIKTGTLTADRIGAGTITGAVTATNFTMDGGSINVHTQGKDDNVIELDWQTDILSRNLKLTPTSALITAHTDMTSISWDDSTSLVAGGFTIHRDRSDNTSMELKYQGDGQIFMSKNGTINVNLNADGTCIARAWNLYSLEEYKKSIEKVDSALEIIKNADVVEYHYNDENDDSKKHIGLAVGEHFNVPKEVIATDEDGNEIGVDIYAMVSLAWKAIQEQNEKIEMLEKRVALLESLKEKEK